MKDLATRILIVEDNADDEELLMRQLTKADLHTQVKVITDGGTAFAYLADEQHEAEKLVAIFLDLELPTLTGVELLTAIRSHERLRHLPVILMTSSNSPEQINRCHTLGISSFVDKPVTFKKFVNAIADTFHNRQKMSHSRNTCP